MNFLFVDQNNNIYNQIYLKFLSKHFKLFFTTPDYNHIVKIIKNYLISTIIINYSNESQNLKYTIDNLALEYKEKKINIIVIIKKGNKFDLESFIKMGIFRVIIYETINDLVNKLFTTISMIDFKINEKRKHIRFNVENHNINCSFKNPLNLKIYTGKVLNISLGGIAFKIYKNDYLIHQLKNKTIFPFNIFFETEMPFIAEVKFIAIIENKIGAKFVKVEKKEYIKLIEFIKNFILIT